MAKHAIFPPFSKDGICNLLCISFNYYWWDPPFLAKFHAKKNSQSLSSCGIPYSHFYHAFCRYQPSIMVLQNDAKSHHTFCFIFTQPSSGFVHCADSLGRSIDGWVLFCLLEQTHLQLFRLPLQSHQGVWTNLHKYRNSFSAIISLLSQQRGENQPPHTSHKTPQLRGRSLEQEKNFSEKLFYSHPHTSLDAGQSHSAWKVDSTSNKHIGHMGSSTTLFLSKLSFVGRIFLHALHRKFLIALGAFILQIPRQTLLSPLLIELSGWWAPSLSFVILFKIANQIYKKLSHLISKILTLKF